MTGFIEPGFVTNEGVKLAVYESGTEHAGHKPPVVMCHGFPELAFSWRHQFPALAGAGYHALALDQRGYGASDAPPNISDYHIEKLTGDLLALLDARGIEKAVFCGHDWGSLVMWALPFYAPDRIAGLISLNVPFKPRGRMDNVSVMNKLFGEDNYINFFQTPGDAEALFDPDPEKAFRFFMRRASAERRQEKEAPDGTLSLAFQKLFVRDEATWPGEVFLHEEELAYFTAAFQKSGFRGGLNWYRNFRANWQAMEKFQPLDSALPQINVPVLMVMAALDQVLPPKIAADMGDYCPQLETHLVKTSGHWTQQEEPEEVNAVMIKWLTTHFGEKNGL